MGETETKKQPLPPGVVLGPDGKPCKVCTAFRDWNPVAGESKRRGNPSSKAAAGAAATVAANSMSDARPEHCPADVESLGRATWTFLHTTAAYYPSNPSQTQKTSMLSLLRSLPMLYPCGHCASHLAENMKEYPPVVGGREELSRWLCERHNDVNERLGKEKFDCGKVDERWKDGPTDGSCN